MLGKSLRPGNLLMLCHSARLKYFTSDLGDQTCVHAHALSGHTRLMTNVMSYSNLVIDANNQLCSMLKQFLKQKSLT